METVLPSEPIITIAATPVRPKSGGRQYLEVLPMDDGKVLVRLTGFGKQQLPKFWTAWLHMLIKAKADTPHVISSEMIEGNVIVSWSSKSGGLVAYTKKLASELRPLEARLRMQDILTPTNIEWRVKDPHELPQPLVELIATIKLPSDAELRCSEGVTDSGKPEAYVKLSRSSDCFESAENLRLLIEYQFAIACA